MYCSYLQVTAIKAVTVSDLLSQKTFPAFEQLIFKELQEKNIAYWTPKSNTAVFQLGFKLMKYKAVDTFFDMYRKFKEAGAQFDKEFYYNVTEQVQAIAVRESREVKSVESVIKNLEWTKEMCPREQKEIDANIGLAALHLAKAKENVARVSIFCIVKR